MTMPGSTRTQRLKGVVRGAVQGVGFRPFVYRLATELKLAGWVMNSAQGVFIEVQGARGALDRFVAQFETSKPARAVLQSVEFSFHDPACYDRFEIRRSDESGAKTTFILPDLATCDDCRRESLIPRIAATVIPSPIARTAARVLRSSSRCRTIGQIPR